MALHPCAEPGCPVLLPRGETRCHLHIRRYGRSWARLSKAVLERDSYVCTYCFGRADTADHVVPVNWGGSDSMSNLVAACRRCNSAKG